MDFQPFTSQHVDGTLKPKQPTQVLRSQSNALPPSLWQNLLSLVKPGIITGNLMAAIGGFFLALGLLFQQIDSTNIYSLSGFNIIVLAMSTFLGIALVIASGCVMNNIIDVDIDAYMERTATRPLVQDQISKSSAFIWGFLLGLLGFTILFFFTNTTTFFVAVFGYVIYAGLYSLWFKRHSIHGTLIGSFSGATPPVMGYVAITGKLDIIAVLLFIIFSAWQMPHSYAIGIFRFKDYQKAGIRLLPIVKGITATQKQMLFYIVVFAFSIVGLYLVHAVSAITILIMIGLAGFWFYTCLQIPNARTITNYNDTSLPSQQKQKWAKKQFAISIVAMMILSLCFVAEGLWHII